MHNLHVRRFALVIAAVLTVPAVCRPCRGDDLRDQLEAIRDGYRANRSSFTHGTCRFRYSIWTADTEADALAGRANDRRQELFIVNTLVFRDDIFIVAPDYDADEVRQRLLNRDGLIPPLTFARIGDFAIDADGLVGSAIIYTAETMDRFELRAHPFALAQDLDVNPAWRIDIAESLSFEGIELTVEDAVRDGRAYLLLKTSSKRSSHDTDEYIDPARGYLSFITEKTSRSTGEFYSRMFLLDVHEENGRYFPLHAMTVTPRTAREGPDYVEVREMKVLDLDLEHVPADEELVVPMHRQVQYSDGVNPNTAKTLYRSSPTEFVQISVFDIEEIYNGLQQLAVERLEGDKQRFLAFVQERLMEGDFLTDHPVHRRALLALTEEDVRDWRRELAEQRGETFDPDREVDLSPFLAISRGFAEGEPHQDYVLAHFADIRHPRLKLAWAALLFEQDRRPSEIVEFLAAAVDSDDDSVFLSALLGAEWPEFKANVERLRAGEPEQEQQE